MGTDVTCIEKSMKDHDDLLKEAEDLAEGMKQSEKIDWSFKHLYVLNHEFGYLAQTLDHLGDKMNLVWNFIMATAVTVGVGLVSLVVIALAKWLIR